MATKVTASTLAANSIEIARKKLEIAALEGNMAQRIAALYRHKKVLSRDDEGYKAVRKTLRDALKVACEGMGDDLTLKATRTLDVMMSYGMNIIEGRNREGTPCDANGKPIQAERAPKGKVAAKRDDPAKETPQVRMQVTREAAIEFFVVALGGEQDQVRYCMQYLLDNATFMRSAIINLVKARHVEKKVKAA